MTSLEQWGIAIQTDPPIEPAPRYEYLLQDADWAQAVDIAIKHREHHPDQAVEIWPAGGSHQVHVVREITEPQPL